MIIPVTKVRIKTRLSLRSCYIYFVSCIIFKAYHLNPAQMPKTLTLWQTAPADSCEQNVRKRNKTPTKRQCPPHSSPLQKTDVSRKGEPNVNKKPCKKDVFCFHAAFSEIAFSRTRNHSAESDFPMSAELAGNPYQKTEKRLLTVEKRCRKPCFST